MKECLEKMFDIPFLLERGCDPYPWVRVTPKGEKGQMFSVKVTNRSNVRLVIDFEPEVFSANIVASMGAATIDARGKFAELIELQRRRGAEITLSVNDQLLTGRVDQMWPEETWKKMIYRATVVLPHDKVDDPVAIAGFVTEWGCLVMATFLSLLKISLVDENSDNDCPLESECEGGKFLIQTTRYERSAVNRFLCISRHGEKCLVCGFDFEKFYGRIGAGFIHVHHIVPVSDMGAGYTVDPDKDLIPVCPNCHAMLHRKHPPFTPNELRMMLDLKRSHRQYPEAEVAYSNAAEAKESYGKGDGDE